MTASRRPALRSALTWGIVLTGFLLAGLAMAGLLASNLEAATIPYAALVAVIPLLIVVPTFLWVDRLEAEPWRYVLFALGWGALVAALASGLINTSVQELLIAQGSTSPEETTVTVVAPIAEESAKGIGVLLVYLFRRREFDGVIDGIVYAGLVGAGFAFTENILYLGRAYAELGGEGLTGVFIVRGLFGPFAHPLFTACTGIALGIAVSTRDRVGRLVLPVLGWGAAVLMHAYWNSSAMNGAEAFVGTYLMTEVPLFIGFVVLVVALRRKEGRDITQHLLPYAQAGWFTWQEAQMLGRMYERRGAKAWARSVGGPQAVRAMTAF